MWTISFNQRQRQQYFKNWYSNRFTSSKWTLHKKYSSGTGKFTQFLSQSNSSCVSVNKNEQTANQRLYSNFVFNQS